MREIIDYLQRKIKDIYAKNPHILWCLGLILAILSAYLLGMRYGADTSKFEPYIVKNALKPSIVVGDIATGSSQIQAAQAVEQIIEYTIVASRNGTKYYFKWCSGVGRIKDENKVWFETVEEAQNAGYGPAKNCPGL